MNIVDSVAAGAEKLPLAEEQAHLEKRRVVTEKVRVHTEVDVLEQAISGELTADHVSVRRVPIDRYVETAPGEKKLLLKEEVHIERNVTTEIVTQTVPVRKQRAVIETEAAEK